MVQIGYTLSSEEFRPMELVELAVQAEELGFEFASISDHYHPWMDSQGQSPFVWTTLGGIAARTSRIPLMTGVTAPIIRYHPAILAQAVATVADMMPGRFSFGVGTGEALNEHVTGQVWPPVSVRQEMLAESIEIMRSLWEGGYTTIQGEYYEVHNARLYTLPEQLPPIIVAASGPESAELAAEIGDALVSTSPDKKTADAFDGAGGSGKPKYGQITVCYGEDEDKCAQTAYDIWGYSLLGGQASQELPLPKHYQEAIQPLGSPDLIKESMAVGPDPAKYHEKVQAYVDAGFTHVYFHQVGQDQKSFFEFAKKELLPKYAG